MRGRRGAWIVVAVAVMAAPAAANPPSLTDATPLYPESYADRPLLLSPGMTELSLGEDAYSFPGSNFGNRGPDLGLRHQFGPVEVLADAALDAKLALSVDSGPVVIRVGAATSAVQPDQRLHEAQFFALAHKWHVTPGGLALFVEAGATLSENRLSGGVVWVHTMDAFAEVEPEVQLSRHVALVAYANVILPFEQSGGPAFVSSLDIGTGVHYTHRHWDLFFDIEADNVTRDELPAFDLGFAQRWGGGE